MTPKLSLLTLAATLAFTGPALAEPDADPRILQLDYGRDEVHRILGAFRTATQVVFSPQETIRHAAIGDSLAWEVAAEGSVLFLKPREPSRPTNLLVVTDRGGEIRHYVFELTARARSDRGPVAYQVRFRYPADEAAVAAQARAAEVRSAEQRLIGLELQRAALEGPRSLAWSAQGASALQPSEVTDNGRFTVLRFPGGQALPVLFEVGEDGEERLVPYDVRGEFVVVHHVPRALRLRRGGLVLCLFNHAWSPHGGATGAGTASPAVLRAPVGDPR